MATLVNLTINGYDIVGSNFDPNRASAYLTPNTPNGLIVVDGASLRLGGKRVKFDSTGQIIFGGLVATNSADNPTSFAYRVTIVYTPIGARKPLEWTSSDFTLTTSLNLANISEAFDGLAIAPTWQSEFRAEMEAIAGLTGEDAAIANRINTPGSATDVALRAAMLGGLAPEFIVNERHPLTAAFHVESFGCVGDGDGVTGVGATDNLPGLNAIVDAILARPDKSGRIIFGPGNFWLDNDGWIIDGENIEVECHPNTLIYTTAPTQTLGGVVSFLGYGNLSAPENGGTGDPAENLYPTPQRERFTWRGGKIKAIGSGGMDNGLGPTRVKNVHISDVIIDSDRKALSAQYGIDNIVWERIVIERGDVDGITIETACKRIVLRDITVEQTNGIGVRITSGLVSGAPVNNQDVTLDNVHVLNSTAASFSLALSDRVRMRGCRGNSSLSLAGTLSDVSIDGSCRFSAITQGSNVTFAKPMAGTISMSGAWVPFGAPFDTPSVYRSADGMVTVNAVVKNGALTAATPIITLPAGYRPAARRAFTGMVVASNVPTIYYGYIEPDGTVRSGYALAGNSLVSIEFTFPAA